MQIGLSRMISTCFKELQIGTFFDHKLPAFSASLKKKGKISCIAGDGRHVVNLLACRLKSQIQNDRSESENRTVTRLRVKHQGFQETMNGRGSLLICIKDWMGL
jgi:hypothetical protein